MKKKYTVVGESIVHGFKKGESFVADLLEHEERVLVEGGHVTVDAVAATVSSSVVGGTAPTGGSTPTK